MIDLSRCRGVYLTMAEVLRDSHFDYTKQKQELSVGFMVLQLPYFHCDYAFISTSTAAIISCVAFTFICCCTVRQPHYSSQAFTIHRSRVALLLFSISLVIGCSRVRRDTAMLEMSGIIMMVRIDRPSIFGDFTRCCCCFVARVKWR